jgi:hypothetical protein
VFSWNSSQGHAGRLYLHFPEWISKENTGFKMDQAKPCSTPMERDLLGEDDDRELIRALNALPSSS